MSEQLRYTPFYRRNLPHVQPPGATFFVTTRLVGTVPVEAAERLATVRQETYARVSCLPDADQRAIQKYRAQRRWFGQWDSLLDQAVYGPTWLADPRIARLVSDSLHFLHGRRYELEALCIMPNHLHLLMTPLQKEDGSYQALTAIMHSLKSYTANQANRLLSRKGAFWQHESYDHFVRDSKEQERILAYILNNPVKAGLVEAWQEWEWTYPAS
ncbi:MAG: REP-associated tyrosine transposase [Ardenticatenaceae bacterium]